MRASGRVRKEPAGSFFYRRGFSLIELIAVILVVSIIAVVATVRFSGDYADMRAIHDRLLAQVQYARKAAIAQRRAVCVHIGGAQSRLFYSNGAGNACPAATGVAAPTGEVPFTVTAPGGMALAAVVSPFQFDALGRYRTAGGGATAAPNVVSVTADGTLQFSVQNDTGYVHP
jgi:MSHA pilin protein MshC